MINDFNEIKEFNTFACILKNCDFDNLGFNEKIKTCIANNIFQLTEKDVKIDDLIGITFINCRYFNEKEDEFSFSSSFESKCGMYNCNPNHNFLIDMKESFLESFSHEFSGRNEKLLIELELETRKGRKKLIKKEIKKTIHSKFKNLLWEYSYHQKQFYLYEPEGTAFLIRDSYHFIVEVLTSNSYYPTIVQKDKVMEYAEEVYKFKKLQWLMYHLETINDSHSDEIQPNINIDQKEDHFTLLQTALIFRELGFYEIIQDKGIKAPLNFIAKLIGKNASRYRAANAKLPKVDKTNSDLSDSEKLSVQEVYDIIKKNS
ncbi:hypothetical protein A9Q93_12915 [Nonlabens dokdonensis]|uniref:Uncharacterized protein n=1 Tax=Nonlabens dokdonensis TaxID=328515 RepID=A0A1Z8AJC6_9FLAO|nr:hypothetical protein [Nonlabens dokdonensis]OUS10449.1 hypothetical protein A9Q93_12915 [Nonlabens dokdonensis]